MILMGNLWGDLLKPRDYYLLSPGILDGIKRHKAIDAYTDSHKAVDEMMRLLRPYQGKYTPVVADVLMDFMLSKLWGQYYPKSIEDFCNATYLTVNTYLDQIPERVHPRINRMLDHRWLESCKNRERFQQTLLMLSRRASFQNQIPDAMIPYDLHQEHMDRLFVEFFENVQQHLSLQSED